jgi:MerR family transcriptional regulator, light-induced transcriptional regulator
VSLGPTGTVRVKGQLSLKIFPAILIMFRYFRKNLNRMNQFSISDLSAFSGIKQHTIRIWEQRYDALKPARSEGNTRHYDNGQLRRLLNISTLKDLGYKVSAVCKMPDDELFTLVAQHENKLEESNGDEYFITQLIAAAMSYDEAWFDKMYTHSLLLYGMKDHYIRILYPLLNRIGMMWRNNRIIPPYEHFISNLIRKKLLRAIDGLPAIKNVEDSWLLFLPEDEYHEIGLLFSAYLIQLSGRKVFYIGSSVPFDCLTTIVSETKAHNLLCFVVIRRKEEQLKKFSDLLSKTFPGVNSYIAVNREWLKKLKEKPNLKYLHAVTDLENYLLKNLKN